MLLLLLKAIKMFVILIDGMMINEKGRKTEILTVLVRRVDQMGVSSLL